jgi:adenosylhomocysteine nucleosidase
VVYEIRAKMLYTIQVSSEQEWSSLKTLLPVSEYLTTPFGEAFTQIINNTECVFFHGGTSKTRSAASCQYIISKWKPQRHFIIGTAGGVATDLNVMDIVIANKTAIYDHIIRMGESYEFMNKETLVNIDNSWIDFSKLPNNITEGFIATADQDIDHDTRLTLQAENVLAADWESGSVALICRINKIPCCVIRGISDIPENESTESLINQGTAYIENTPIVMETILKKYLYRII